MDVFKQAGEAMLLAHDGEQQFARTVAAQVRIWLANLRAWHAAMPGTLPATEYQPR